MRTPDSTIATCLRLGLACAALLCALPAQGALWLRRGDLVQAQPIDTSVRAAIERLCAGPSAGERAQGLESAVPAGTRLVEARTEGTALTLVFDEPLLLAAAMGRIEQAIEQITKTAFGTANQNGIAFDAVHIRIRSQGEERDLSERIHSRVATTTGTTNQPQAPQARVVGQTGGLSGLRIAVAPGHGYYWHSTLGWTTQRGVIDGTVEDIHCAEICNDFVIPMLLNMGAEIVLCREHGEITAETIGDNEQGSPVYAETGGWTTSVSLGYAGLGYRFATSTGTSSSTATASATWTLSVPRDGVYPVYVYFRAGSNRSGAARYTVHHTGGATVHEVDQRIDDRTWVWLGDYAFSTALPAQVTLDNLGPTGSVVIADAVRIGAGNGTIARGAGTSGQARWREASRYWAQYNGAPSTVWDSIATGEDNDDDVGCRPRFAEWRTADAYVALHTNAGGGAGTSTFIHDTAPSAGSTTLRSLVHTQIVNDVRAEYLSTWQDRGQLSANFGEVRLLTTMPGILLELAFHDTPGSVDLNAIHDPRFRYLAGRAIARGVLRYFQPAAAFPPEPPTSLRVVQDGARGLRVSWTAAANATSYIVEGSPDGKGFVPLATVTGASTWSTGPLPFDSVMSFRVRSKNGSGQSFPTEALCAGTDHLGQAQVLLVQGFDRLNRTVPVRANTKDFLARFGRAIRDGANFSVGFDACSNEAVKSGQVALANYKAVIWASGEESTTDETFDATEQFLITGYLNFGGRLFVSGAEIGWDLDAQGTAIDRAFYNQQFGASYASDDAGVYTLQAGVAGTALAGMPAAQFDNGTFGTYDVDFADVIAPFSAQSTVCLRYGNGLVAGIQRSSGNARVLCLGFPFETITTANARAELMRRALQYLLDPLSIACAPTVALGQRLQLQIRSPLDPGELYLTLCSYARAPGIALPGGGLLPLQYSFLVDASLDPTTPVFGNFLGALDAQGAALPYVDIPPLPFLIGLPLYFSGLTAPVGPFVEDRVFGWCGSVITP